MFKSLISLFTPDPIKKMSKVKDRKYKQAVQLQRDGDLRAYAQVMNEITMLEEEICRLVQAKDDK